MNGQRSLPSTLAGLLFGALVLACGACSILEPDEQAIRVENGSEAAVLFLAWELQSSHLLDLAPSFQVNPDDGRILPPGKSRILAESEISGGFQVGDDLRFFLYDVVEDTADYKTTVTLTAGEYAVNPPGTWHTADVDATATALFITAGAGTEHRPR